MTDLYLQHTDGWQRDKPTWSVLPSALLGISSPSLWTLLEDEHRFSKLYLLIGRFDEGGVSYICAAVFLWNAVIKKTHCIY